MSCVVSALIRALFFRLPKPGDRYILDDRKHAEEIYVVSVSNSIVRYRYLAIVGLPDGMLTRGPFHFKFKAIPKVIEGERHD